MKRSSITYLLLLFLIALRNASAQPRWEPVSPVYWGSVTEVVANTASEPIVASGYTLRGRLESQWITPSGMGDIGTNTQELMRAPSGTLYAWKGGAKKSTDNGHTWSRSERINVDHTFATADALYKLDTLARSIDDGTSWQSLAHPFGSGGITIAASDNASTIFARQGNRIAVSTDQGRSWRESDEKFDGGLIQSMHPGPGAHFVVIFNESRNAYDLYRSTDDGATWKLTSSASEPVNALRVLSSSIAFLIRSGHAYRSTDGGMSWSELRIPHCAEHIPSFTVVSIAPNGTAYLGTIADGLWESNDQGATWSEAGLLTPGVPTMACLRGTLFASITSRGWESTDRGQTWECVEGAPDAIDSNGTWYRNMSSRLEISTDHGASWSSIISSDTGPNFSIYDLAVTPRGTLIVVAGRYILNIYEASGVMRLGASGDTWTWPIERSFQQGGTLYVSPAGTLYYLSRTLYRSTDDGRTWQQIDTSMIHQRFSIGGDETLYSLAHLNNRWVAMRSTDMGTSWQQLSWGADSLTDLMAIGNHEMMAIVSNGSDHGYVFYSPDRGESIIQINAGLGSARPLSLLCESDGTTYLRSDSGLYRTSSIADIPIPHPEARLSITAWPLPARDEILVRIDDAGYSDADVEIVRSDGTIVLDRVVRTNDPVHIDVRSLPSGYYLLVGRIGQRTVSTEVIIAR